MGRPLISHRPGRVERPRDTRSNPKQRAEHTVPDVLPESLGDRGRAGPSVDNVWLEKELQWEFTGQTSSSSRSSLC